MLSWDTHKYRIIEAIKTNHQSLRISVKTKDESHFIKNWVEHHRKIVGDKGLIIFDNGSTEKSVLDYYSSLSGTILIVSFSGFMNNLHRPKHFPELYAAMRESSDYYTFIDTDEFIYWASLNGSYHFDPRLVASIIDRGDPVIPGLWLENVAGYHDRLWLSKRHDHLVAGIRSGKPILSSRVKLAEMNNHNFHILPEYFQSCSTGNIIVAHMKRLYPEQRVKANIAKLKSYKYLGGDFSIADLIKVDITTLSGDTRLYVREVQDIVNNKPLLNGNDDTLRLGNILLRNGTITFADQNDAEEFYAYLKHPSDLIRSVLGFMS